MNDRTVHRAVRAGAKTVPVDNRPRPKEIRGNVTLTEDELTTAMEMARSDRIEQDIRAYAYSKKARA